MDLLCEGLAKLGAIIGGEARAEVQQVFEDVRVRLEVFLPAPEMDESRPIEAPLLVEHESDAPRPALDRLAALAACRVAARALCAVDSLQAALDEAFARGALERGTLREVRGRCLERRQHRLRPLVRRAHRMEPELGL